MSENFTAQDVMGYTVRIAAAYLTNNQLKTEELLGLLKKIFHSVVEVSKEANNIKNKTNLVPFVPIEESIHNNYIVCLEDGKKLQMLKRHLSTVYKMTMEQYREKWGLPRDYPAVAPEYAKKRSVIARATGLGNMRNKNVA
ncbi:MAG: MucR family transcriptional regulator [Holosporales bacterium]|jgi:predicted transcriptional regulator|nr:MucR family transcriptional regulator [Holosporales bacterium]